MKKIISLLVATALSMTAFASIVSANSITSSNKATLAISYVEIDEGDALEAVQEFAADAELEDYSYYRFTVVAGNLPALTKSSTKYTGEAITGVSARVTITSDAEYEAEWFLAAPLGKGSFTVDGNDYTLSYFGANDLCTLLVAANVAEGGSQDVATFDMVISNDYSYTLVLDGGSNMAAATFASATKSKGTDPYNITSGAGNITVDSTPILLNSAPVPVTTYTITFKTYDGSANVNSTEYNENDAVTAPSAPVRSGYTFSHWSETQGGAAATVLTTATADKTYYAVYTKDPVITDSSIDVKESASGKTGLTDLQGKDVTLTANYGIAKFSKAIDTVANNYFVVATDSNNVEKEFEVDFAANGVEISNASTTFFAIVKSADHIIKNIRLKEVAK